MTARHSLPLPASSVDPYIFVPVPPTPRALPVSTSVPSTPVRKRVLGPLVAEGFQEHTCIPPGPAADKERGQKSRLASGAAS